MAMKFIQEHFYLIEIGGILAFALICAIFEKIIFRRVYPKICSSSRVWDGSLLYAFHLPLQICIWFSGLIFSLILIEQNFTRVSFSWIQNTYKTGIFFLLIWALFRLISKFERQPHLTVLRGVTQILKAFVFLMGGLGILQLLGIPLSAVIAFGGVGGIAVGFAAKDLLANFFGGLMIFLDKPFQVGDWVRSPDKEIEGTVEHIGWRLTRIRTLDQRPLFVPNSVFSTISLENPSRMTNRRIKATLGLSYEDSPKIQGVLVDIEHMLKHHPGIDQSKESFVNLINFGAYSLEVTIYAFTKTTKLLEFQAIQQEIFLKVLEIIDSHACKLAYPVASIQFPDLQKSQLQKNLAEVDQFPR